MKEDQKDKIESTQKREGVNHPSSKKTSTDYKMSPQYPLPDGSHGYGIFEKYVPTPTLHLVRAKVRTSKDSKPIQCSQTPQDPQNPQK